MKKILILGLLAISGLSFAQAKKPVLEQEGNVVKATYYYDNGKIEQQGISKMANWKETGLLMMRMEIKNQLVNMLTEKKPGNGFSGAISH